MLTFKSIRVLPLTRWTRRVSIQFARWKRRPGEPLPDASWFVFLTVFEPGVGSQLPHASATIGIASAKGRLYFTAVSQDRSGPFRVLAEKIR